MQDREYLEKLAAEEKYELPLVTMGGAAGGALGVRGARKEIKAHEKLRKSFWHKPRSIMPRGRMRKLTTGAKLRRMGGAGAKGAIGGAITAALLKHVAREVRRETK